MKKILLLISILLFTHLVNAQNPSRIVIKGSIKDTAGTALSAATVMLLQPKDSSLVNFARANESGTFEFKNVRNANYILKVSYVGYLPYQQVLSPSASEINDLGNLKIKPIAKELIEVVVKTARAPLTIRGDTIEYNASSFKVPPGSSVEDLLRRLPGIEVDASGNIKAQGKDVKKVLVDGKTFFGDDPKAATKNLGAETISKIQVFNDKSEQAKLTGVDDGKKEKAINLELKEEFKKGAFGKVTVAAGTESRGVLRGNYNRFNKKEQFSILGYTNNINETGVNWNDYGEFKGNNSFNNNDNGDFGFANGGSRYNFDGGDLLNNFDGKGFTNNFGTGLNYNYTFQKTKFSSSYFYNQTRLSLDQFEEKKTFLQNSFFSNTDTTGKTDFRRNHSVAMRVEQMLDSSNTLIAKANLRVSHSDVGTNQSQRYFTDENTLNTTSKIDNSSKLNSLGFSGSLIFRHKFKKKGRNFALSTGLNTNTSDGTENLNSLSRFLNATNVNEQVKALGQLNQNENKATLIKSSLFFLEPISKKMYWESFYNFSTDHREVGREAFNALRNNSRFDSLSTFYKNTINYNRVGTSLRYSFKGVNVTVGLAALRFDLEGKLYGGKDYPVAQSLTKSYDAVTPNISSDIALKNNTYLSLNYTLNVQAPDISYLQPVVNNNNPFYIITGNPDLLPEKSNNLSLYFNKFDPATFSYINLWTEYNSYSSQIVYNQTVDENFVTRTRPENLSGGKNFNVGTYIGFPIVKTKFTLNLNGNASIGNSPTFINGVKNETDNKSYQLGLGFNINPSEKLLMNVSGRLGFNNINYSIEERQNQQIRNHGIDASVKWNFAKKLFLETNLDYKTYRNDRFGFDQNIPIYNCSVRKLFGKENKVEVRLAAFDIFNKRQNIVQMASQNYVTTQRALTLARYFMLSFTYNMKGHADKLKKNGGW